MRTVVVTAARVMTKASRAVTVAGATRAMATMATKAMTTAAMAARLTLNGNKHNNQILSRHQW